MNKMTLFERVVNNTYKQHINITRTFVKIILISFNNNYLVKNNNGVSLTDVLVQTIRN